MLLARVVHSVGREENVKCATSFTNLLQSRHFSSSPLYQVVYQFPEVTHGRQKAHRVMIIVIKPLSFV